jgi:hypothetical protein
MLRARAACWLWFSPATLAAAAAHTCQLLREFALGDCAVAAPRTLLELLPREVRSDLGQVQLKQICVFSNLF